MFLQRLGIYVEQKRILICLGKRRNIFRDVLKSLLFFVVYFVSLSCGACDSCHLQLPLHEAEEISLKDKYFFFLINDSRDRKKPQQWASASRAALFFPSLPQWILECFAAVRSKGGCTSVSIEALRSHLPLAGITGFRRRGTLCQTSTMNTGGSNHAGNGDRCIYESCLARFEGFLLSFMYLK